MYKAMNRSEITAGGLSSNANYTEGRLAISALTVVGSCRGTTSSAYIDELSLSATQRSEANRASSIPLEDCQSGLTEVLPLVPVAFKPLGAGLEPHRGPSHRRRAFPEVTHHRLPRRASSHAVAASSQLRRKRVESQVTVPNALGKGF